jgi:hypothetical protein
MKDRFNKSGSFVYVKCRPAIKTIIGNGLLSIVDVPFIKAIPIGSKYCVNRPPYKIKTEYLIGW